MHRNPLEGADSNYRATTNYTYSEIFNGNDALAEEFRGLVEANDLAGIEAFFLDWGNPGSLKSKMDLSLVLRLLMHYSQDLLNSNTDTQFGINAYRYVARVNTSVRELIVRTGRGLSRGNPQFFIQAIKNASFESSNTNN